MITVHLIFNAHIDPVWLWPWPSGLDALLSTCRSACDLLDEHPELHFCRGEAWGYDLIERVAPTLFARIRGLIEAGRWHIVGGWWIQPDCNGPSGFALERQIGLGKEYFLSRFARSPRIAWNVDSFGHAASLPGLMRAAGQDRYVMMRPQEHEMSLPARVFRWRGQEGGAEVVVFRIAGAYACRNMTVEHVRAALSELPAGIEHTMCFVGLGDHGCGPTEEQIAWCRQHERSIDGCRLVFSYPEAFFAAIWNQVDALPVVTGELQSHAIGCYSVHRPIKVAVRRAEHALAQAETSGGEEPTERQDRQESLTAAWRRVCFAHFHDIYGGTCIPSAYAQAEAQVGLSQAVGDERIHLDLRRRLEALPDDPLQRIVLLNASNEVYDGYATHEAWFEREPFHADWRLIGESGADVPFQMMAPEALVKYDQTYFARFLVRVRLGPGELRVLRIGPAFPAAANTHAAGTMSASRARATDNGVSTGDGVAVCLGGDRGLRFPNGVSLPAPRLDLIVDPTDTWSHGLDRYGDETVASAVWEAATAVDSGPLMASVRQGGRIGSSELVAEWRVYAGEPFIEMHLRVNWVERHKVLKLTLPLPAPLVRRFDGIPGAALERRLDGRELPVRDRTLLEMAKPPRIGLVFPDVYALDATSERVRLTLLRSPLMAHHDPYDGPAPRGVWADRGEHVFRVRINCHARLDGVLLDRQALMLHRPLVAADLTRGMRWGRRQA